MPDYTAKSYGRNAEVDLIFQMLAADRDISMPGPRRLGKTFLLDRLVDAAPAKGWVAIRIEVAGDDHPKVFFRRFCAAIGSQRSGGANVVSWIRQRVGQVLDPRNETAGPWYQPLLALDHETYFDRLIAILNEDTSRRWVLLIDELPIFLKAMHDKGSAGIDAARNFMNLTSRLRATYPRVRWLITGSIGLEPLARAGNYMGVLAKFHPFELLPLNELQARDYVQDIAREGRLPHRATITNAEAAALIHAAGWLSTYYLDALAMKLQGGPCEEPNGAAHLVEQAMERLLQPAELTTFAVWEEHLTKHYQAPDRALAHAILTASAPHARGIVTDNLLANLAQPTLDPTRLRELLLRMHTEGFVTVDNWGAANGIVAFRNPLLRRWWQRFNSAPASKS